MCSVICILSRIEGEKIFYGCPASFIVAISPFEANTFFVSVPHFISCVCFKHVLCRRSPRINAGSQYNTTGNHSNARTELKSIPVYIGAFYSVHSMRLVVL